MNGLNPTHALRQGYLMNNILRSLLRLNRLSVQSSKQLRCSRYFASKDDGDRFYDPPPNSDSSDISNTGAPRSEGYVPRRFRRRQGQSREPGRRAHEPIASDIQHEDPHSPSSRFQSEEDMIRRLRDQTRTSYRPKDFDPRETCVVLFPGQGSQFVGMGNNIIQYPSARKLFDRASEILRYDLLELCLVGPKEKLDRTEHCQPAVFVTSLAALEVLKELQPLQFQKCVATAGFSVGEYAAAVFANVLSFEDALKLLMVRAKAMQEASEAVPSGMMTVRISHQSKLSLAKEAACEYCRQKLDMDNPVLQVASYLSPEHKVIAGHREALDFVSHNAKDFNLFSLKPLPVSGAFHTRLMGPAQKAVGDELHKIQINVPRIPLHSNVDGKASRSKEVIKKKLRKQITSPVKWEQIMHTIYSRSGSEHFPVTFEVGPGKQLGFMLRLVNLKAYKSYKKVEV